MDRDFDAVVEILRADELDDSGRVTLGEVFLRSEWEAMSSRLASDAWVAQDTTKSVVGYAQTRLTESAVESWGVVHLAQRGRGIGGALLDQIVHRATEMLASSRRARLQHSMNSRDQAAAELLAARSFRPLRHHWHMERFLEDDYSVGASDPPGFTITDLDVGDLPELVRVLDEALRDDRSYRSGRFEEWAEQAIGHPAFDPTLWQVGKANGIPVGAVTTEPEAPEWISFLVVQAASRGTGVGTALLHHLFAKLSARGIRHALVNVDADNPSNATAVYDRAGMQVVKRWTLWERDLGLDL